MSDTVTTLLRRGAIVAISFDPSTGSEVAKVRPAVIVSNNTANAAAARTGGVITVIPLTSNTRRVYPFQVLVPAAQTGLPKDSKAQAEQLRSVSVTRIRDAAGWMPEDLMRQLDDAIRVQLAL
ncbi:type II toxin-antitoxin system PemK/MazF family toxin [Homoserinibacter sp. GY 40078]|uniref:type II toxin-antitoxin system PemK/MazF family toxin n=1 Tax=Homoserinibacter sp. GY 40078 TaxID=2603275 RepID=UPI0011C9C1CC|nr:type II toxin-antitoxin system PemK/MazF family toxin [Homoserinibacter sp. GY 40078]TXK17041.1 type II toxin-antitoxin system PemK/MazF family toxin [Homoserinibacter sp. GY 40078]